MLRALGRIWSGPVVYRHEGVEVRERDGVRTLHLDSDTVQSAMRLDRPDALELSYTRAMMAFLLFVPPPRYALLVGLGGGSLAKFMYRMLPETRVSVVEVSAAVIEAARMYFHVPEQCARLSVTVADGAARVESIRAELDALLVDAYDGRSLAASLATDEFFDAACRSLSPQGALVMNLWSNDRLFDRNLQRIERAFCGRCLCLPAERPGNVIVLGFARVPDRERLNWVGLFDRAAVLQERFELEFPRFVAALRTMNRYDSAGLSLPAP